MRKKEEIANNITNALFEYDLLNVVDACSVEDLEKHVNDIIMDYLKDYLIISGQVLE